MLSPDDLSIVDASAEIKNSKSSCISRIQSDWMGDLE